MTTTDPIHDAAQALLDAWDSPDRWSNPGYERVKKAETALRDALAARAQPTTDPSGMVLLGHWDPERDVVYGIHDDLSDVARAGLVPVYRPSGSAPLETHPEHQWVWVGGALIDAVVIHKEWQRYQQASMDRWDRDVEAQPTTDDVLWEGETARIPVAGQDGMAMDHWSAVLVPPGTRGRFARATDQPPKPKHGDRIQVGPLSILVDENVPDDGVYTLRRATDQPTLMDPCTGGGTPHEFVPGVEDAESAAPDPRWCNVCGETRRATGQPSEDHGDLIAETLRKAQRPGSVLTESGTRAGHWYWLWDDVTRIGMEDVDPRLLPYLSADQPTEVAGDE